MCVNNDLNYRKECILKYSSLVFKNAKKFETCFLDFDDLVSAGYIGLICAVDGYNSNIKESFKIYASRKIRDRIRMEIQNYEKIVSFPDYLRSQIRVLKGAFDNYVSQNLRVPSIDELAFMTGFSVDNIKVLQNQFVDYVSLDDCLALDYCDENLDLCLDYESLREALYMLDDDDMRLILYRYGFYDGKPKSYGETSLYIGDISREGVRLREKTILKKLKQMMLSDEKIR